jgi:ABC-2 type transport system permease protein
MVDREFEEPVWVRRFVAEIHDQYLAARKSDSIDELPVIRSDDQAYLSYGKASHVMFALQDLIGAEKVNGALRAYHARFVDMKPPFPTTLDLLAELRKAAGPEYQELITDLFERITLYDLAVSDASARAVEGGYEVTIDVTGKQLRADGAGAETEVPLDTWFQVAVFPESDRDVIELEPQYLQYHRLHTGTQRITVRVAGKPGRVGVDPFRLMIDRGREDNLREVAFR